MIEPSTRDGYDVLLDEARAGIVYRACVAHAEMIRARYPGALPDWPDAWPQPPRAPELTEDEQRAIRFEAAVLATTHMRWRTWAVRNPEAFLDRTSSQLLSDGHIVWFGSLAYEP